MLDTDIVWTMQCYGQNHIKIQLNINFRHPLLLIWQVIRRHNTARVGILYVVGVDGVQRRGPQTDNPKLPMVYNVLPRNSIANLVKNPVSTLWYGCNGDFSHFNPQIWHTSQAMTFLPNYQFVLRELIPGLPFPGCPGFLDFFIPVFPGMKTSRFPGERE